MLKRSVWRTEKAGAIDRLKLVQETIAPLEAGKVCIAVKSIGLNFADIFAITGLYSATPQGSFIPGLEFSGVFTPADRDAAARLPQQYLPGTHRPSSACPSSVFGRRLDFIA